MNTTTDRVERVRRLLDALDWVREDRVHSDWPSDLAPIRLDRPGLGSRCITAEFLPVVALRVVERVPDHTAWQLTGDGWTVLKTALVAAGGA